MLNYLGYLLNILIISCYIFLQYSQYKQLIKNYYNLSKNKNLKVEIIFVTEKNSNQISDNVGFAEFRLVRNGFKGEIFHNAIQACAFYVEFEDLHQQIISKFKQIVSLHGISNLACVL